LRPALVFAGLARFIFRHPEGSAGFGTFPIWVVASASQGLVPLPIVMISISF